MTKTHINYVQFYAFYSVLCTRALHRDNLTWMPPLSCIADSNLKLNSQVSLFPAYARDRWLTLNSTRLWAICRWHVPAITRGETHSRTIRVRSNSIHDWSESPPDQSGPWIAILKSLGFRDQRIDSGPDPWGRFWGYQRGRIYPIGYEVDRTSHFLYECRLCVLTAVLPEWSDDHTFAPLSIHGIRYNLGSSDRIPVPCGSQL